MTFCAFDFNESLVAFFMLLNISSFITKLIKLKLNTGGFSMATKFGKNLFSAQINGSPNVTKIDAKN
jgi:hypothetical protein